MVFFGAFALPPVAMMPCNGAGTKNMEPIAPKCCGLFIPGTRCFPRNMDDREFAAALAQRSSKYQSKASNQLKSKPSEVEVATAAHVQAYRQQKAADEARTHAAAARQAVVQSTMETSRITSSGLQAYESSASVINEAEEEIQEWLAQARAAFTGGDAAGGKAGAPPPLPKEFISAFQKAQVELCCKRAFGALSCSAAALFLKNALSCNRCVCCAAHRSCC